jgi:hypothetical protein
MGKVATRCAFTALLKKGHTRAWYVSAIPRNSDKTMVVVARYFLRAGIAARKLCSLMGGTDTQAIDASPPQLLFQPPSADPMSIALRASNAKKERSPEISLQAISELVGVSYPVDQWQDVLGEEIRQLYTCAMCELKPELERDAARQSLRDKLRTRLFLDELLSAPLPDTS